MAFTYVQTPGISPDYAPLGSLRTVVADFNVTSYVNPGGETLVPETFGMKNILGVIVLAAPRGFVYNFTVATRKLTVAQDNGTATAAALPEIPNGNNHGTVRVLVVGV